MGMDLHIEFKKVFGTPIDSLREDQIKGIALLSDVMRDIVASPNKLLFCFLHIEEPDLFGDRPVMVATNIRRNPLKDIISHAYERIVIKDKLHADDDMGNAVQQAKHNEESGQ